MISGAGEKNPDHLAPPGSYHGLTSHRLLRRPEWDAKPYTSTSGVVAVRRARPYRRPADLSEPTGRAI